MTSKEPPLGDRAMQSSKEKMRANGLPEEPIKKKEQNPEQHNAIKIMLPNKKVESIPIEESPDKSRFDANAIVKVNAMTVVLNVTHV